ncbi:MAG: nuclear transport factor 2 family protein [Fimbriimonadaceae bacterium]|nr:nuclear transport factor 2 family protein [Alphaproteobacteria bacterium]
MARDKLAALVDRYAAAWGERDARQRLACLDAVWAADGRYRDPTCDITGRAALSDLIAKTQTAFPDSEIVILSRIDTHRDWFRFSWALQSREGKRFVEGIDIGVLSDNGQITEITGFFSPPDKKQV